MIYYLDRRTTQVNSKQNEMSTSLIDSTITIPTTYFDLTVKELGSKNRISLVNQELPDIPVCNTKVGDTIVLCKSYGEKDWHVESYHNEHGSEVDHCEEMTDAKIISIDGISSH
jgi:hypothetical protein